MHPFFTLSSKIAKTKLFLTNYPTHKADEVAAFLNMPLDETKRFLYAHPTHFNRTTSSPPYWCALERGFKAVHNGKDWDWE